MRRFLLAASLLALAVPAEAASTAAPVIPGYLTNTPQPNCTTAPCFVPYGVSGQSVTVIPYPYTAMGGAQYNQAATTSTALTVPTGAVYARICAITGQMNFVDSTNGTPTTGVAPTVGTPLAAGACIWESGASVISVFKLINAVASTGTWTAVDFQ